MTVSNACFTILLYNCCAAAQLLRSGGGHYFNKSFQISKKLVLEDEVLHYYYRNGASKQRMGSLTKDLLEIAISPIQFLRDEQGRVVGFEIIGLVFQKI